MYLYFAITLLNGRPWWRQLLTTMQISQVRHRHGFFLLFLSRSSRPSRQFLFDIVLCVYASVHVILNGQVLFGSTRMQCHGTMLGAFFGNFVLIRCFPLLRLNHAKITTKQRRIDYMPNAPNQSAARGAQRHSLAFFAATCCFSCVSTGAITAAPPQLQPSLDEIRLSCSIRPKFAVVVDESACALFRIAGIFVCR